MPYAALCRSKSFDSLLGAGLRNSFIQLTRTKVTLLVYDQLGDASSALRSVRSAHHYMGMLVSGFLARGYPQHLQENQSRSLRSPVACAARRCGNIPADNRAAGACG